jgi:hypothetical protein
MLSIASACEEFTVGEPRYALEHLSSGWPSSKPVASTEEEAAIDAVSQCAVQRSR